MTEQSPTLAKAARLSEAVEAVRALLGGDADDVTCEVTRTGTLRIVAKRGAKAAGTTWGTGLKK